MAPRPPPECPIGPRPKNSESALLGETLALDILEDQKKTYNESYSFTLTKFDGKTVTI